MCKCLNNLENCTQPCNQPQFQFGDKVWYGKELVLYIRFCRIYTQSVGVLHLQNESCLSKEKPKQKVTKSIKGWKHKESNFFADLKDKEHNPIATEFYIIPATLIWEEEVEDIYNPKQNI